MNDSLVNQLKDEGSFIHELYRLSKIYGKAFLKDRIGTIKVFDVTFPFYAHPSLWYLSENSKGHIYEPGSTLHLIEHFSSAPICFIDIGAHYGYFSSLLGSLHPDTIVYAFEPNPVMFSTLERNMVINNPQGKAYQLALSDETSTIPFQGVSMKVDANDTELRVPAEKFDNWCATNKVLPSVVKIDVHGSEGKVLFGMQETLKNQNFSMYLEIHPQDLLVDYTLEEIVTLVLDSGFQMFEIHDFREQNYSLSAVNSEERSRLIDPDKWTSQETEKRRMFYCEKV